MRGPAPLISAVLGWVVLGSSPVAVVACRGETTDAPLPVGSGAVASGQAGNGSATANGSAMATGSASGSANASDPWSTPAKVDPDAPPSLGERAKLVNAACPIVKAPYFFEVTAKNGKISHLLGTRHVSVGLAKFPEY